MEDLPQTVAELDAYAYTHRKASTPLQCLLHGLFRARQMGDISPTACEQTLRALTLHRNNLQGVFDLKHGTDQLTSGACALVGGEL
jgi:hypothetical protein